MSTIVAPAAERREPSGASDSELVTAVRSGDERAFGRLYERYHRRIAAYVYGMVNDYGRAEDLTQDVFISALRRMRETDRSIAFKPWIYEIAKNACIDQFRRTRRTEEVSFEAEQSAGGVETARLAAVEGGPDEIIGAKQQLDDLCGAFGGLSDTHHQILVMRELEGLSYREIGEKMGLSRPSVESTLFRARRRLTEEYDELVSGERCLRVQSIILTAVDGLGARDQRRMLRHVAHCQPCRREARLAGVEVGTLSRHPARDAVAAKVAAFLPFPFLFRGRRGNAASEPASSGLASGFGGSLSGMAEPLAGWSKAAVAAVTLLVAGAGAGAVTTVVGDDEPTAKPAKAEPAAVKAAESKGSDDKAGRAQRSADRGAGTTRAQRRAAARKRSAAGRDRSSSSLPAPATAPSGGSGSQEQQPASVPVVPATGVTSGLNLGSDGNSGGSLLPQELRAPATSGDLTDQITDAAGAVEVPVAPAPVAPLGGLGG